MHQLVRFSALSTLRQGLYASCQHVPFNKIFS